MAFLFCNVLLALAGLCARACVRDCVRIYIDWTGIGHGGISIGIGIGIGIRMGMGHAVLLHCCCLFSGVASHHLHLHLHLLLIYFFPSESSSPPSHMRFWIPGTVFIVGSFCLLFFTGLLNCLFGLVVVVVVVFESRGQSINQPSA